MKICFSSFVVENWRYYEVIGSDQMNIQLMLYKILFIYRTAKNGVERAE